MKITLLLFYFICASLIANSQTGLYDNYKLENSTKVPTYQSKTDSELELLAYGAYLNNKNFNHYYSLATKSFADHYFTTCISYTDNALQTGLANAGIYFLRGKAFKELKDIHSSKKNFKMARKYGDYESKVILKNWKAYIKP